MKASEPKPLVSAISDMDKETFCKHMTARHQDSLGGMSELSPSVVEYDENLYRAFHKRLHETRVGLEHEHERATDPNQHWQDRL